MDFKQYENILEWTLEGPTYHIITTLPHIVMIWISDIFEVVHKPKFQYVNNVYIAISHINITWFDLSSSGCDISIKPF